MTHRELKKLAKQIAACEQTRSTTQNKEEKEKAELKIMKLSQTIVDIEDFAVLDGLVQDLLKNNT